MERGSPFGTATIAGQVYRSEGLSTLLRRGVEYAINRSRIHPGVHWRVARAYYLRRCANDVAEYEAAPDPFRLAWIDPDRIVRHTRREYPPYRDRMALFGAVRGGNWDRRDRPPIDPAYRGPPARLFVADRFEESVLYRSLEAHFDRGVPWAETELVREALALLGDPTVERVWHECTTAAEIRQRCRRLDRLYESIREEGYRSRREQFGVDPAVGFRDSLREEMAVDVGRDGELLLVCGKHRLAIAKLLDLDRVPVVFLVRHPEWMRRREAVARGEVRASHPDLRDLRAESGSRSVR